MFLENCGCHFDFQLHIMSDKAVFMSSDLCTKECCIQSIKYINKYINKYFVVLGFSFFKQNIILNNKKIVIVSLGFLE